MENELRNAILEYMKREKARHDQTFLGRPCDMPTWWFKFHIADHDTKGIRRELERMERDGLVISDRSQSNNTKWILVDREASHG